jgi:hypothetical protein
MDRARRLTLSLESFSIELAHELGPLRGIGDVSGAL